MLHSYFSGMLKLDKDKFGIIMREGQEVIVKIEKKCEKDVEKFSFPDEMRKRLYICVKKS